MGIFQGSTLIFSVGCPVGQPVGISYLPKLAQNFITLFYLKMAFGVLCMVVWIIERQELNTSIQCI